MFHTNAARGIAGGALTLMLAGALAVGGTAHAQTPTTQTPPAAGTAPAAGTTPAAGAPAAGARRGHDGFGGGGKGHGGPGGFDGRGTPTADSAANAITRATDYLTLVKADLTYATGKTDIAAAQGWLNAADALISKASAAQTAQQYGQAGAYAQAARSLGDTAGLSLAQALGADKLPSYSQRTGRDGAHGPLSTATAPTQAQASRELQRTYNELVSRAAVIGSNADAKGYLAQAQASYRTAYSAYQAGNYQAAGNAARLAGNLAHVADSLYHVTQAGTAPDAPVTVPAPNF
ncbi:MAG TPA: hypothetical protein VM536_02365 [Chloroflexia bacterium]|nr:hypothetical protein [Chloroflexia bacterium]